MLSEARLAACVIEVDERVAGKQDAVLLERHGAMARGMPRCGDHARSAGQVERLVVAQDLDGRDRPKPGSARGDGVGQIASHAGPPGLAIKPGRNVRTTL